MRLDPKLVHPTIFKATDAIIWSAGSGDANALSSAQSLWLRESGVGFAAFVLAVVALIGISTAAMHQIGVAKPIRLLVVFSIMALALGAGALAARRRSRSLSVEAFETMLPTLDLTVSGRAYGETIVSLYRSGRPITEIEETATVLNSLLDEEARLLALRTAAHGRDPLEGLARLEAERQSLAAKAESARDGDAREAYAQSLALLNERTASFRTAEGGSERIDAHLELLRQAVLATRDAARRLAVTPEFATDSLRAAVALARAQTTETERALAELRSI